MDCERGLLQPCSSSSLRWEDKNAPHREFFRHSTFSDHKRSAVGPEPTSRDLDCFVVSLLGMTKSELPCHCEPADGGRGNLNLPRSSFSWSKAGQRKGVEAVFAAATFLLPSNIFGG